MYDGLFAETEQEKRQRAQAERIMQLFGREERARRRDGLRELESQLDKNNQDLR